MMTLTETPTVLDPARRRFIALVGIATGVTADKLLAIAAPTADADEVASSQIAEEIVFLAWCGFTESAARAVLDERSRAKKNAPRRPRSEEQSRAEIRAVAAAMLRQEGPAAVGLCRQAAATAAQDGDPVTRRSFLEFATAAEQLLAEGFDRGRVTP